MVEYQLPKLGTRVRFPSLAPYIRTWGVFFLLLQIFWISGCATTVSLPTPSASHRKGVYHSVHKGETLWRIARVYQVSMEDIIQSNNIPNVAHVEENQLIFIPDAEEVKELVVDRENPHKEEFSWPIRGKIIQYFGERKGSGRNTGIGIQTQEGQAVVASRQGRVVFADYLSGYANTIILDHLDGYFSVYAQNAELLVKLGALIAKGDKIAKVGKNRNGSFLHFEIRRKTIASNPLYYLPKL